MHHVFRKRIFLEKFCNCAYSILFAKLINDHSSKTKFFCLAKFSHKINVQVIYFKKVGSATQFKASRSQTAAAIARLVEFQVNH